MRKGETLTEGNICRQLIFLSLPLLAGNLVQQLYHTVDMLIVGKFVGGNAFSSVGICTSVVNLFTCILIGFNMGFSILYANHYGAGDYEKLRRTLFSTGCIGMGVTVLLTAMGILFLDPILGSIRTPPELMADCQTYLFWVFLGLLFAYFYNSCAALLRGIGKTDITLWVLVLAMVFNGTLDYLLVALLQLGVWGAALATVFSQGLSAILCYGYLWRNYPQLRLTKADITYTDTFYRRAFSFGSVAALQQSSVFFGKLLIQGAINTMGTGAIHAYTAAVCIESIFISLGDSASAALSIFTAQNCGVGNADRVKEGRRKGMRLMMETGGAAMVFLFFTRKQLLSLLLVGENPAVLEMAATYLSLMCIFLLGSFAANVWQGYYRGIGRVTLTFYASVLQIVTRVVLTYTLVSFLSLHAVAIACGCGWASMIILHYLCYPKYGDWRREKHGAA